MVLHSITGYCLDGSFENINGICTQIVQSDKLDLYIHLLGKTTVFISLIYKIYATLYYRI